MISKSMMSGSRKHCFYFLGVLIFVAAWGFVSMRSGRIEITPPRILQTARRNASWRNALSPETTSMPVKSLRRSFSPTTVPGDGKQHVVILASMRTGSSFVGELLANNGDVFYLFEPGLAVHDALRQNGLSPAVVEHVYLRMLPKIFLCDFSDLDFYMEWLAARPLADLLKMAPRLYDLCVLNSTDPKGRCVITPEMATETCQKSDLIVIKSIRVPDINLLLPMVEEKTINLKVIHLVRDPRPMIASRAEALKWEVLDSKWNGVLPGKVQDVLCIYCKYNCQNLELGTQRPSLKNRYMFLRYEDAALNPRAAALRIYRFLGRDGGVPDSVQEWIDSNTGADKPGTYSTARNSREVYRKWRLTLPVEAARAIEKTGQCRGMMARMGYLTLEDKWHLRNMSRPLLGSLPPVNTDVEKYDWVWF
ncbi:carbohydrate sulfotransferase 3-like [Patiria miniata]|uniref:Sulfotransferase domain-containing protein n=1 Tax=Patiria miniata TaxID=46514 RepID=A0A914AEN1_PATMI|nr:carbohydrate sulfotransferase 3-like [Patiria miniata]